MRKFLAVAVLALLACPAHAREVHEFTFGRHVVRIEVPKRCKRPSCLQVYERDTSSGKSRKETSTAPAAAETVTTRAATVTGNTAAKGAARTASQPGQGGTQNNTAAQSAASRNEPASESEPDGRKATARLSLPGGPTGDGNKAVVASNANAATAPAPRSEPAKSDVPKANFVARTEPLEAEPKAEPKPEPKAEPKAEPSPIGLWQTEGNQGQVRIEACGQALCGHTEGKPNEKILIDMVKATTTRWNGRISDIRNGRVYTSFIQLKGANSLRVEGCAFGGLFCGGETWARVQ
jgi:uncharacterized protein (DUF2147 family)